MWGSELLQIKRSRVIVRCNFEVVNEIMKLAIDIPAAVPKGDRIVIIRLIYLVDARPSTR